MYKSSPAPKGGSGGREVVICLMDKIPNTLFIRAVAASARLPIKKKKINGERGVFIITAEKNVDSRVIGTPASR